MKKLSLLALIFSFTAGIALAESKRQSTDKVEYPEAVAMKLNIELPIIGKSLGGTPEDLAGGNEVLNRSESHNRISDMLRQVNIYDVGRSVQLQHSSLFRSDETSDKNTRTDDEEATRRRASNSNAYGGSMGKYEWWTFETMKAEAIGFDLTNGRVSRMAMHFKQMSGRDVQTLLAKLHPKSSEAIFSANERYWSGGKATIAISKGPTVYCYIWRNTKSQLPSEKADTCVIFEVDPTDWYVAYNKTSADIEKAMRASKVVKGMNTDQAMISMRDFNSIKAKDKAVVQISWYSYSDHWKENRVIGLAKLNDDGRVESFDRYDKDSPDSPKVSGLSNW
ncbi:MAG TPA: hypothetical protein VIL86_13695 [Tepidisphaeraceae bacterium]|jgi:uncharacterized protein YbaA (DUF1428 family)